MGYKHIRLPAGGQKITIKDGQLAVPDNPILGVVEGDGIGPDIVGSSRVDLQACKLEYSIVSPK